MNIFITGSAGFIGSHLTQALLKNNHHIIGLDNFDDFYNPEFKRKNVKEIETTAKNSKGHFKIIEGDICDEKLLKKIFHGNKIEAIIHLAAMAGVRPSILRPVYYEKVNCLGTYSLLEAAKENGIKKFIFGSSSSVYGLNKKIPFKEDDPIDQPFSPYAATKKSGELACFVYHQLYEISFAVLRFFTVYGPRQRPDLAIRKFTDLIYKNETVPIYGDGSFSRDFTYVDDIVDGIIKSLDWVCCNNKFEIFNLGESQTTTVNELLDLLEKQIGKKANRVFKEKQPGDVPITFADITKAKKILGYNPQIKIKDGIPKFLEWYKS